MKDLPNLPDVEYYPSFLSKEKADDYFFELLNSLEFKPETYTFKSRDNSSSVILETKRKMSYHSEKSYSYSNQVYKGNAWNSILLDLKKKIEDFTGYDFNAVLCNHYDNGEAGMGWHADKEKELGDAPIIASLSFGESRVFAFRHRKEVVNMKNPPRLCEYNLGAGDLLIMKGDTQKYFEHCVVKNKSINGTRINLTFRKIVT